MENFYNFLNTNPSFKKIEYNKFTIIEYDCPLKEAVVPIWSPHDYVVYVLNGRKTWYTQPEVAVTLQKGDTAYIKKGGHFVHQHFEDSFCLLALFIPDEIKKELSFSDVLSLEQMKPAAESAVIRQIKSNAMLQGFFYSVTTYFRMQHPPTDEVKILKFKEFVHLLSTESENIPIIKHLLDVGKDSYLYLKTIMSRNYMYNLSLKEFAELCNRSISSFRRDFIKCYNANLSSWLSAMRLNHASSLLIQSDLSVSQVALESGFENLSHFSRCFREKFGVAPSQYRLKVTN